MSNNNIVDRVLDRLDNQGQINEDQLVENVIQLLEDAGVDLDNISEEKLEEIFKSIGKAMGSFMTGGEFKDPARRNKDFTGAIKNAGFKRKMAGRQAARAEAAKAAQAAQAAKAAKKKPMAKKPVKANPAMQAKPAMQRKPLSKKARNTEYAAAAQKARTMRRKELALEDRVIDVLAQILVEDILTKV